MFTFRLQEPSNMAFAPLPVSNMLNKLHGQPESYDKKYVSRIYLQDHANLAADQGIDLAEPLAQAHMEL